MRILRPLLSFLLFSLAAAAYAQNVTYDCATSGANCSFTMPDPSGGITTIVSSTMNVPSLCASGQFVSEVIPRIDVTHPFVGDLSLLVQEPSTAFSELVARPQGGTGSCAGDNIVASFQDGAARFACSSSLPANGSDPVAPATPLRTLAIFARTGSWRLQTTDYAPGNVGTLNGWSLTFVCSPLNVVSIIATDPNGGESGPDPIVFTVTRTGVTTLPLNVSVAFTGTASSSADYTSTFATIPAGQASIAMTVTPILDSISEGPETVIATIQPFPEYVVGTPSSANAVLLDVSAVPAMSPLGLIATALFLALAALFVLRGGATIS